MEYHGFTVDEEVEVIEGKHQGVDWVVVGGTKCFVDLQKKNSGERAKAMPKNIRSRPITEATNRIKQAPANANADVDGQASLSCGQRAKVIKGTYARSVGEVIKITAKQYTIRRDSRGGGACETFRVAHSSVVAADPADPMDIDDDDNSVSDSLDSAWHNMNIGESPTLENVSSTSQDWHSVEKKCGSKIKLLKLERMRNNYLQVQYASNKKCMEVLNGEQNINELPLFHGTSRLDPRKICLGNQGFDPRVSNDGFYGQGTYFADTAEYSHLYAHRDRASSVAQSKQVFQIILAKVACGVSKDYGTRVDGETRGLRRPPKRDSLGASSDRFADDVLYDSIRAGPHGNEHGRTHMYVVYNKLQAIPEFLITYEWLGSDSDSD